MNNIKERYHWIKIGLVSIIMTLLGLLVEQTYTITNHSFVAAVIVGCIALVCVWIFLEKVYHPERFPNLFLKSMIVPESGAVTLCALAALLTRETALYKVFVILSFLGASVVVFIVVDLKSQSPSR